ncbi:MAG: class I SAM-dependent methyltransferase [Burkholderiales bacterium]
MGREPVHGLTRREIYSLACELQRSGRLYGPPNDELHDVFNGSVDRFCEIADRLRHANRVLDVGAGHGMLLALLHELGHYCEGVDFTDPRPAHSAVYAGRQIRFQQCNVEIEPLPFNDGSFDAVVCCQVLEHFSHSHLPAVREMRRVLRDGGIVEIDVPNAASFRNRSRMLRGKNITYDYREHYLHAAPVLYKGHSFFPLRHNREFTRLELQLLLAEARFRNIEVRFLKSRRHRAGLEKLLNVGTAARDAIPSLRKSLIAFASK